MTDIGKHASCQTDDFVWADVEPAVSQSFADEFDKIYRIERSLQKQWLRKRRLRDAGGRHTEAEIAALLKTQQDRCFYCYAELLSNSGKRLFHRDHFVAIECGGNNDIANIVLSCDRCNIAKGIDDPDSFIVWKLRQLSKEIRVCVKLVQKAVHTHKSSNPSIERTRNGRPHMAFISFSARCGLPSRAAHVKR